MLPPNRPHADFFSLEIFGALDVRLAKHAMSKNIFHAGNENEICEALHESADVADRARDADLGVAVQGRCGRDR